MDTRGQSLVVARRFSQPEVETGNSDPLAFDEVGALEADDDGAEVEGAFAGDEVGGVDFAEAV